MTPSSGTVSRDLSSGIATIVFGHPKGNSLPSALLRELAATIDAVGSRDDVRVIVLRSEGTGPFCAGASFDELRALRDERAGLDFFSGFAHVILAMRRAPQFVITRVHGKAVGGGVGVVAASDYAIATSAASLRLSELAVGIGPFVVGPVIEHKIGTGHFTALSIDYDWRDAAWGERVGLYAKVTDSVETLDREVNTLAERLASANPAAVHEMKRVSRETTEHWTTQLYDRAAISGTLILTSAAQNSLAALSRK